jgi:ZIP family zinc transporter
MSTAILAAKQWLRASDTALPARQPWRRALGFAVAALGLLAMVDATGAHLFQWLRSNPVVATAFVATLFTAAATGAGALPVLVAQHISARVQDAMLGFGAGVMLAATAFSLIVPGIAAGEALTGSHAWAAGIVAFGVTAGGVAMLALDRMLPHEHFIKGVEGAQRQDLKRIWLFVLAIAIHNVPEGLAVGVGFGTENSAAGVALALGIGIQNIPEGLVVALALITVGYSRGFAAAVALASGLVEPVGGLIGAGVLSISRLMLPWGLAFAAGAMLFVVSHEIIPESHRKGHEREATVGLLAGFVTMMLLDTTLA